MTWLAALALVSLVFALVPALVYRANCRQFLPPPPAPEAAPYPAVSVLIPARNEERSIGPALESVLASRYVTLEVIVLDDQSEDGTAAVVERFRTADPRVRLERGTPLPAGWCGKQHACATLATFATTDRLTFLDADVRLAPDALARLIAFQDSSGAALVSGFPRQETVTLLEKLILPLINWLLMAYLPMARMRRRADPELGAGCGQWFLARRADYEAIGGHGAVRASLHDGVKLPRAFRAAGRMTDIADATDLAVCRMYTSAGQVWNGLAKNAREGMGGPVGVWVWTVILFTGQVMPSLLLAFIFCDIVVTDWLPRLDDVYPPRQFRLELVLAFLAYMASVAPRQDAATRFKQSRLGATLHPVGVTLLLAIQWYATVRAWLRRPVGWKGRAHPSLSSEHPA